MILETLLGAFLQVLFDRLATRQVLDFFRDRDFDRTLFDKLKTVMLTVTVVLTDAEEKQITNLGVKGWLNELRDAFYHADDLLDEINTITLQAESEEAKIHRKQLPGQFSIQNPDYEHGEFCCKFKDNKPCDVSEKARHLSCSMDQLNGPEKFVDLQELRLATRQVLDFFRDRDFDRTLFDKLKTVMLTVTVVLTDAEEKQITNLGVKGWLNELRDAFYHADDLLDEINTITLQAESEEAKIHRKQLPGQFSIQNPDYEHGEFCCKFKDNKPCDVSEKARHLSCSMDQLNGPEKFVDLQELRYLRSFLPLRSSNTSRCTALSNIVSDVWLQIPKQLRVVSFSGHSITELPEILGQLIHLCYLDLSHTLIRELPRSTCSLYNLQTLLLSGCHNLTVLPENIGDLVNLRHLDVTETSLREMPLEFGRLKSLQVLTEFVVSTYCGSKISELGSLSHLRKLSILRLQNVVDATIASAANLGSKNYIEELVLKWTSNTHDEGNELAVLDCLQPHKNLRKLTLENYGGIEFPN
nr:putative disease resistance rpp13-like protein 1 [Quercus suber]